MGCQVQLGPGQYLVLGERVKVGRDDEGPWVQACQTQVLSESGSALIPSKSRVEQFAKIDEDFALHDFDHRPPTYHVQLDLSAEHQDGTPADAHRIRQALMHETGLTRLHLPLSLLQSIGRSDPPGIITATMGRSSRGNDVLQLAQGTVSTPIYGLAIDIGTTTVVIVLVDLTEGTLLHKASMYNQQIRLADDIASRISCCEGEADVAEMRELVIEHTINPLIDQLCERASLSPGQLDRVALSGNTVMTHLALGINPERIGRIPFTPVINIHESYRGAELGLSMNPNGLVDVLPSISGYVGGDIVSDMHVAQLMNKPEATLLVDIGTNGEIVFSEQGELAVSATAAGPAFEGAGLTHGCRAATGAIESIRITEHGVLELAVIGNSPPIGLCGSAIVDFMAEAVRVGWLNLMGRFDLDLLKQHNVYHDANGIHACIIYASEEENGNEPLFVSELDLSQVMKAKAAVYAGMKALLTSQGKCFADLKRLVLAGGFARHLNLKHAMAIGLLPALPLETYDIIGNGSLAGAYLCLVNGETLSDCEALARLPDTVELNREPSFEPAFIDALALPHLDPDEFATLTEFPP